MGRNDFQVKIRGFRIELGEIEARLAEHAGVGQAVVVTQEGAAGDKRLVAYCTGVEEAERGVMAEELRRHLSASLPEYMAHCIFRLSGGTRTDRMGRWICTERFGAGPEEAARTAV